MLSDGQEYRHLSPSCGLSTSYIHSLRIQCCESYLFQVVLLHPVFPDFKTKRFSLIIAKSSKLYVSGVLLKGSVLEESGMKEALRISPRLLQDRLELKRLLEAYIYLGSTSVLVFPGNCS